MSPADPEVEPAVGTEVIVGAEVGAVGPVGVASSCPQNPFTMDVADAMSAWYSAIFLVYIRRLVLVDEGHRTAWHIRVLDEVYFFIFFYVY